MAVNKIDNTAASSISKIDNTSKDSISKIDNETLAAPGRSRVAIAVGESAHIMYCTADDLTDAANWTLLDLGSGGYDDIAWGYDSSGKEVWILTRDNAANPMYIAVQDANPAWVPSGSDNWVSTRPDGGRELDGAGHRVSFGSTGSNDLATWAMTSISNSEYAYYVTGTITDSSAWCVQYRGFDTVGNGRSGRPPPIWNRNPAASMFVMAMNNPGAVFSSVEGTGSEDNGDWDLEFNPGGSNANNKGNGGYGNGVWVIAGQQSKENHVTGSGTQGSMTWGLLNAPALNRPMIGVATDMAGKWVMCGNGGYIWVSTDDAETWTETRLTSSASGVHKDMKDVAYDNDGTWLIVGSRDFWVSSDLTLANAGFVAVDPEPTADIQYNAIAFNVENSSQ